VSRGQTISFSFPPFAGWVKRIILTCTGIYFFQAVMGIFAPLVVSLMREWLALIPVEAMHGKNIPEFFNEQIFEGWGGLHPVRHT